MTTTVRERVLEVIEDCSAKHNLAKYFDDSVSPEHRFTGRLFEQFGGGGDHPAVANRFTADDLLAVEALSVRVPPDAAYEMLHGVLARELADLLAGIPTSIDLGTPEAVEHLSGSSAADQAWSLLKRQHGVGWVTAGKLLARKRPRLLPVYDEVVACVLGHPESFWLTLNDALDDSPTRDKLDELRSSAPPQVSALRVVDVAVWMKHQLRHREGSC